MNHPRAINQRSSALDFIRCTSAVVVMSGHLRNALLVDHDQLQSRNLLVELFYFISGMGHQAVIVFFVLSGYFVGGSVIKAGHAFSVRDYTITRLSRIWTVLIPAIALTALVDGFLLGHYPRLLGDPALSHWHSTPNAATYSASVWTAIQNVLFLQTISAPTYGTNGPLWSLANEAWYYLLFPCVFSVFRKDRAWLPKASGALIALAASACMPREMLALFTVWLLGAAIHLVPVLPRWVKHKVTGIAAIAIFLATLAAVRMGYLKVPVAVVPDLILGIAFAAVCLYFHHQTETQVPSTSLFNRASFHLSEMSFTLYVVHMPLIFMLAYPLLLGAKLQPNLSGMATYAALFAIIMATAWALWWAFERNTPWVRQKIKSMVR